MSTFKDNVKINVQLQEIYLVTRKNDETFDYDKSVEALFADVISVYPVIKALVDDKETYFSDFDSIRINGKVVPIDRIKRWNSEKYGKIEFFWYEIMPEKLSYQNNLSEGKIDKIEYRDVLTFSSIDWEQVLKGELGTRRFKVEVKYNSQRISTPGKENANNENLLPEVFRVSIRENKEGGDNVDYMTFFFNLPYIWGNSRNQVEHFIGVDCQDLAWFGLKEAGFVSEALYDHHIHDVYRKKIIFDGYVMMDGRTIRKDSTNVDVSIKRGDVVRLAEYGHYGVIYKDCDKQSKVQESSNGKLDNSDLVIHILFDKPRIESLGTLIWRYNDNHIQIFRF
ncbi:hypothetical protein KAX75_07115 [candidate division WOR-3 bacterium]|nr:hypothetical protein [candidate division WOR-3 bacterium]